MGCSEGFIRQGWDKTKWESAKVGGFTDYKAGAFPTLGRAVPRLLHKQGASTVGI